MGRRAGPMYYLVMNPGSRHGKSAKLFRQIHQEFSARKLNYEFGVTSCLEDATILARRAVGRHFDVITAVGGDGTINRVINGFYDEGGHLISQARLGVIYSGTSPDFCLSHHLPIRSVGRAVDVLTAGISKKIGIGCIRYQEEKLQYFACCANVGFGPELARAANSGIRGKLGDKAGTFIALLQTLKKFKPFDITVNGKQYTQVYNLSIGKTRYVASGLKVYNELQSDDERFYIFCVKEHPLQAVFRLYMGSPVTLEYNSEIVIEGSAGIEFDGDPRGKLPVTIASAPSIEVIYEGT